MAQPAISKTRSVIRLFGKKPQQNHLPIGKSGISNYSYDLLQKAKSTYKTYSSDHNQQSANHKSRGMSFQ